MKKMRLSFYYITLAVFCQVLVAVPARAAEITEVQRDAISDHCESIRENLRSLQREDSRARVYLGRYYETIISKFITPLNVRLVENNLAEAGLVDNQAGLVARRGRFVEDFIAYQQGLEELVRIDCKTEPERFYEKLVGVREERAKVNRDTVKMGELIEGQVKLVSGMIGGMK